MDFLVARDQDVVVQSGLRDEDAVKGIARPGKLIRNRDHIVKGLRTNAQPHPLREAGQHGVRGGIDTADFMQIVQFQAHDRRDHPIVLVHQCLNGL